MFFIYLDINNSDTIFVFNVLMKLTVAMVTYLC